MNVNHVVPSTHIVTFMKVSHTFVTARNEVAAR